MTEASDDILVDAREVTKHFPIQRGFLQRVAGYVKAVNEVNLTVRRGETLGLVGESGCGKTTFGRCLLRLIEPTSGQVLFHSDHGAQDILSLGKRELRALRRQMQMIFQDPQSSLDPRMTIGDIVAEPLVVHGICSGRELEDRVAELLRTVGLRPHHMRRYPHAFSGGQRQRIGIARALALRPRFVIADEPVSALDVSIRAQLLNLLADLKDEFGLSYLFVAHDLSAVAYISDRVAVMYLGRVVELAEAGAAYRRPLHPYTEALLSAVPLADPHLQETRQAVRPEGEPPDPANPPSGCPYHPRCHYAQAICPEVLPPLEEIEAGHLAACHFAGELELKGI